MKRLTQTTKPVSQQSIIRKWHLIDVNNKVVGRIAPRIATLLQGKHKANYVPYLDMGDHVVIVNAQGMKFSGSKLATKVYTRYSGYPDGLKKETAGLIMQKNPARILELAVSGMLPKNKLRDRRMSRLYVFPTEQHSYQHKFTK